MCVVPCPERPTPPHFNHLASIIYLSKILYKICKTHLLYAGFWILLQPNKTARVFKCNTLKRGDSFNPLVLYETLNYLNINAKWK